MSGVSEEFKESSKNTTYQCSSHPQTETGPTQGQNPKTQTEQCHLCYTVPGGVQWTGETKQPHHKQMAQHKSANFSGQDSDVHLDLKKSELSFEDSQLLVLCYQPLLPVSFWTDEAFWRERTKHLYKKVAVAHKILRKIWCGGLRIYTDKTNNSYYFQQ